MDKVNFDEYVQLLASKSNEVHVTTKNKKTGPAVMCVSFPVVTCVENAPCRKECYACKGYQKMANSQAAYLRNYRIWTETPDFFFEQLNFKIRVSGLPKVRFFDSGDFPNINFLKMAVKTAEKFPEVKFMAFTKKYKLVNYYITTFGSLPENFKIYFSAWDKGWFFDNPNNLPVAYVNFKDKNKNPEIPNNCFKCPGKKISCSCCGYCFQKESGSVVFEQH